MKRILFFATPSDIKPVLEQYETNAPLKFVNGDMKTTPNREIYLKSRDIPDPGISTSKTGSGSARYIVSLRDTKNTMSTTVDDLGQRRWMISHGDNEDTVLLTLAGLWRTGTLLPGNINTLHDTPVAQHLMRWFLSALKQEGFTKLEVWWLGHEALEMLRAGKRLATTAEQSPREFDLRLSE